MSGDISLNFTVSDSFSNHSNIVAETYLRKDSIILEKKNIISRKIIDFEIITFDDFLEVNLLKSKQNSLDLTILIKYSKGSIYLKSSDNFGVKWFFDNLISNLEEYNETDNNFTADNKLNMDDKVEELNNFLDKINTPLSKKDQNSFKKKNKFYNYCLSEER